MRSSNFASLTSLVALLAEGVDRNHTVCRCRCLRGVALLAEGVDRNTSIHCGFHDFPVALLAEGVDRNTGRQPPILRAARRPPRGGRG